MKIISNNTTKPGPLAIGLGLAIVLANQLWPIVPLAAAMAIIGWGAALTIQADFNSPAILALNQIVYLALTAFAILAESQLRNDWLVQLDIFAAIAIATLTFVNLRSAFACR